MCSSSVWLCNQQQLNFSNKNLVFTFHLFFCVLSSVYKLSSFFFCVFHFFSCFHSLNQKTYILKLDTLKCALGFNLKHKPFTFLTFAQREGDHQTTKGRESMLLVWQNKNPNPNNLSGDLALGSILLVHEREAWELFLIYATNNIVWYGRQHWIFTSKLGVEIDGITCTSLQVSMIRKCLR